MYLSLFVLKSIVVAILPRSSPFGMYEFRRCSCTFTFTLTFTFIDVEGMSANETLLECTYMVLVLRAATLYGVDKQQVNQK